MATQACAATRYVIRRKADGWFYAGPHQQWSDSDVLAWPFEFMTIATAALLFEIGDAPELFEIVPMKAAA